MTSWTSGLENASVSPRLTAALEPTGNRRRQPVERTGQHVAEQGVDVDGGEQLLRDPVGERGVDLGLSERIARKRGDLVAVEQGHPGPNGDRTHQEQHDRQYSEIPATTLRHRPPRDPSTEHS